MLLWRRFDGAYEQALIWLLGASAILGEPSTLLVPIAASVAVLLWLVGRRAGPLAERGDRVRLRPDVLGVRPDDPVHRRLLEDVGGPAGHA